MFIYPSTMSKEEEEKEEEAYDDETTDYVGRPLYNIFFLLSEGMRCFTFSHVWWFYMGQEW